MDGPQDEFAIRVRDLVVGFGRQTVLDHLSLDVRRGEILGLVGASGGGKSVLMRTIIGLIPRRRRDHRGHGAIRRRPRSRRSDGVGHPVPAGRAVLLADGAPERPVSAP
ncbi:ABC-type transporter Mla maintaining outer membrane lipid asymmetry ATPase subunit MlaF [Bradyrhizobium liaoningense]